jgi:hypothetical protein
MAILDLIPHLFPTGSGASTLDLTASGHRIPFLRAHPWIIGLGLGVIFFVFAALKPWRGDGAQPLSRPVWVLMCSVMGVLCLIAAAYFAVHGV